MFNFSIIGLVSLILIYKNILLINEETLILICFIIFCWIAFTRLSDSLYNDLINRSKKIENSLTSSLNEISEVLTYNIENQHKLKNLPNNIEKLGNHFFKLNSAIANHLPLYISNKSEVIYTKKFLFIQRLESQTIKLLALLLVQKLSKLVEVQKFCTYNLKVRNFICFQSINFLNNLKNL